MRIGRLEEFTGSLGLTEFPLAHVLSDIDTVRAEFLGMVSHELRMPLTSVMGAATALLNAAADLDPAEMRQFHRIIKGNRIVPTYDCEGNPTSGVRSQRLFHALDHHRYCVVSGEFVHDISSDEDTPGLPNLFGTKIKVEELLDAVGGFLEGSTVNDLVGMLRGRLEKLTVNSPPRDIILAHQNIYALTELVGARLEDEALIRRVPATRASSASSASVGLKQA